MFHKLKSWLYEVLIADISDRPLAKLSNYLDIGLTLISIASIILLTEPSLENELRLIFIIIQTIATLYFVITYILRLWAINIDSKYSGAIRGRLSYMKTPYMIVDLLSILPFIAFLIFGSNMQVLWALQIFRIAKLFKLKRVKSAMIVIINVIKKQREPLLITLFVAFTLILSSGFIMYFVENPAQPEVFSSISKSMWWAVITLTTIGYGDMYPITPLGQFLGGIIALCGIAIIALPSGIIASGFSQEIERYKKLKEKKSENQLTK